MKIILLSLPRTGSTSFAKSLSNTLDLPLISIPDEYTYKENGHLITKILNKKKVILRISPSLKTGYELIDFIGKFDRVIFLSRKNNYQHYRSFVNLYYKLYIKKSGYHDQYDSAEIPQKYYNELKDRLGWKILLEDKEKIEQLSLLLNIPVLYYEDLYFSSTGYTVLQQNIPNLDIEKFKKYIASTKRMKLSISKTLL